MLIRGQTTEERIAQIAQGFGQGFQNFQGQQDRQRAQEAQQQAAVLKAQELQMESERRQQALERQNKQDAMAEKNYGLKEKAYNLKVEELKLPFEQTREFKKATAIAGVKADADLQKAEQKKQIERQEKVKAAQVPDFEVANPEIVPTTKDAEEVKKQNQAYKNFSNLGGETLSIVRNLNGYDRTGLTNNWASLQQKITEMRLQAKEMANLGVLNGPDLGLVDQTLGGLDLVTLNRLGPEAAAKRVEDAITTAESKLLNAASARGYRPRSVGNQPQGNDAETEAELAELAALRAKAGG